MMNIEKTVFYKRVICTKLSSLFWSIAGWLLYLFGESGRYTIYSIGTGLSSVDAHLYLL